MASLQRIATASAKIILVGEHAVVYGVPAIAIPVSSLRASASFAANPPGVHGLRIVAADLDQMLPVDISSDDVDNALALTARLVLRRIGLPVPNVTITVTSHIPMASGLGSGAAVSTAIARAVCLAADHELSAADLNSIVYEVEKIYHGTPSGIDNTVIVYEQPVYFRRDHPIETFSIGAPLTLVIGDTGKGALTKVAVGAVRELVTNQPDRYRPIIDAIAELVKSARIAIEEGDLPRLGELMNQNHMLLQQLTVSSLELDLLTEAARKAGAFGAKLSGGGRGGNMIALVAPEKCAAVEQALIAAGAVRVFVTQLNASGGRA